jgi:hypothetical protein
MLLLLRCEADARGVRRHLCTAFGKNVKTHAQDARGASVVFVAAGASTTAPSRSCWVRATLRRHSGEAGIQRRSQMLRHDAGFRPSCGMTNEASRARMALPALNFCRRVDRVHRPPLCRPPAIKRYTASRSTAPTQNACCRNDGRRPFFDVYATRMRGYHRLVGLLIGVRAAGSMAVTPRFSRG